MNIIKSLFAFLVMLVATLFTASHAQAFALGNHAGGFFLGTLDCTEINKPSTRNLCRENGWLNYDTLSGCSVATKNVPTPKPRVNKLGPDPDAVGPHTRFKTDQSGKVTGYTEFDGAGNAVKRFRGTGKPHGGQEPPFVLEPKPGKGPGAPPKVPRPPRADELPNGY
jgi:hypothetical protein